MNWIKLVNVLIIMGQLIVCFLRRSIEIIVLNWAKNEVTIT